MALAGWSLGRLGYLRTLCMVALLGMAVTGYLGERRAGFGPAPG